MAWLFALENSSSQWLLNFKGGSFLMPLSGTVRLQAVLYGVSAKVIDSSQYDEIERIINDNNMHKVTLEKAPKIAVYTPRSSDPWDDAVTLVMNYAKIPYSKLWNDEVLSGELFDYDWLHLHHEDFTGQYEIYEPFVRRLGTLEGKDVSKITMMLVIQPSENGLEKYPK